MMYECEYFLAIVEAKNLNRAAQALYISPSALSQFLSKLENRLGQRLFVREKNILRLTEAGRLYYEAAKQIEEIKKDMMLRMEQLSCPEDNAVRIAVSGTRALNFATELWPVLCQSYPNCSFYLSNDISGQIYEQILEASLDFGIMVLDYDRRDRFQYFCLRHDEVGLLIPEGHRIHEMLRVQGMDPNTPVDIDVCRGETLLLGMRQSILTRACQQYFRQERFSPHQLTYAMQGNLVDVAKISGVVALCPAGYVQEKEGVVFQRLKNPVYYDLGIVCRKDRKFTPVEKGFLELAKAHTDKNSMR